MSGRTSLRVAALGLMATCLLSSGCVRLAKQGLAEVRGAKAEMVPVSVYEPSMIADYDAVQFDPVTSSLPSSMVSNEFLRAFDAGYKNAAATDDFAAEFPGGGQVLRVATEVQYLQKLEIFDQGMAISRVRFYAGPRQVLDIIIKATNQSLRAGSTANLATKSAETIAELLVERPADMKGGFLIFK